MAGPQFILAGARAQSASAASIAPAKPAVNSVSGALIALVQSKNNAAHSCGTAGWTLIAQVNSGAGFTASIWIAAEGAAAPTFTWTGAAACAAQIAYYADAANSVNAGISISGTTGSGTVSPHTSTGFTSDGANVLAVYLDAAAANTALTNPAGWIQDVNGGSATDVGRTTFGSKAIATSGTGSGNISTAGAAAAWVQFQIELKGSAPSGAQASKIESNAWLDVPAGLTSSKIESDAWLDIRAGLASPKIEGVAWLDKDKGFASKIEGNAWLDPPAGLDSSLIEAIAWLDPPPSTRRHFHVSIIW